MAMKDYPLHPITHDWAELKGKEREELKADFEANGQRVPILVWKDQIVDGKHRLAFCRELGRAPKFDTKTLADATEGEMEAHVRSLNQYRRSKTVPLSEDEKKGLIKAELKANPKRSNNVIAKLLRVSPHTVQKYREELESTLQIAKLEATEGADGKKRKRPPPRRGARAVPQRVPEPTAVDHQEPAEPQDEATDVEPDNSAHEPVIQPATGNGHDSYVEATEVAIGAEVERNAGVVEAALNFLAIVKAHALEDGRIMEPHEVISAAKGWLDSSVELTPDWFASQPAVKRVLEPVH
jgi:hypothetical protein